MNLATDYNNIILWLYCFQKNVEYGQYHEYMAFNIYFIRKSP